MIRSRPLCSEWERFWTNWIFSERCRSCLRPTASGKVPSLMWMVNLRAPYNSRRLALAIAVILLLGFLLLPSQTQGVFQQLGGPVGWFISWPLRALAGIHDGIGGAWNGYVA